MRAATSKTIRTTRSLSRAFLSFFLFFPLLLLKAVSNATTCRFCFRIVATRSRAFPMIRYLVTAKEIPPD